MELSDGPGSAVAIGVGETFRRDDGCGPHLVAAIRGHVAASVRLVDRVVDPTALLDLWSGARLAVVVDAMRSGRAAGTVVRLEGEEVTSAPSDRATSSHAVSLREAIDLGRALGRMPERLVVYLIEAGDVRAGEGLSDAVQRAVDSLAPRVATELNAAAGAPGRRT
jgi:hydrogenase maturation protease